MKNNPKPKQINQSDAKNIFVTVDSPNWRNPELIDLVSLRKLADDNNFTELPDNTRSVNIDMELATDDNFLYIKVKNGWKRLPLSSF